MNSWGASAITWRRLPWAPYRHEGGKIAVMLVVAQEHFRGWQRCPFSDRIHLDGQRLLVRQAGAVEGVPRDIVGHVPADALQRFENLRVEHAAGGDKLGVGLHQGLRGCADNGSLGHAIVAAFLLPLK